MRLAGIIGCDKAGQLLYQIRVRAPVPQRCTHCSLMPIIIIRFFLDGHLDRIPCLTIMRQTSRRERVSNRHGSCGRA